MSVDAWAALLTSVVAAWLGVVFTRHYRERRLRPLFWWSLSFWLIAVGTALQWLALIGGAFTPWSYRTYVVVAAAIPATMGAGSMFLLWKRWAWPYLAVILVVLELMVMGTAASPLNASDLRQVLLASQEVTRVLPSGLVVAGFAILGSLGGAALVVGALLSWGRTRKFAHLELALGGIVFSLADTLSAYGIPALFYASEVLGILLIYLAVAPPVRAAVQSVRARAP